jgi:hypothetical protein
MLAAEYSFAAGQGVAQHLLGFGVPALLRDDQREHVVRVQGGALVLAGPLNPSGQGLPGRGTNPVRSGENARPWLAAQQQPVDVASSIDLDSAGL